MSRRPRKRGPATWSAPTKPTSLADLRRVIEAARACAMPMDRMTADPATIVIALEAHGWVSSAGGEWRDPLTGEWLDPGAAFGRQLERGL